MLSWVPFFRPLVPAYNRQLEHYLLSQRQLDSITQMCKYDTPEGFAEQKQSNTEECAGARESKEFLHCDVPLTELRTLLELKKLYLEIQKLKREIKKL
ncbi:hypothetical protein KIL84_007576 [Mauremys mutica]|uniref:Uncharacterized protein n=1 Tax=Mauremys mutica TaxID=74926 RepID=A0A9D4AV67_9SAUR|nr:hypothetical protein KIL84_007576 [Mauremys mutica]